MRQRIPPCDCVVSFSRQRERVASHWRSHNCPVLVSAPFDKSHFYQVTSHKRFRNKKKEKKKKDRNKKKKRKRVRRSRCDSEWNRTYCSNIVKASPSWVFRFPAGWRIVRIYLRQRTVFSARNAYRKDTCRKVLLLRTVYDVYTHLCVHKCLRAK